LERELKFLPEAEENLAELKQDPAKAGVLKQVNKTLTLMRTNLNHPSLNPHPFTTLKGPAGEPVFEIYAQQHTPAAYRVFFFYGPDLIREGKRVPVLSIVAITPHP
jgi:hypothetical protein